MQSSITFLGTGGSRYVMADQSRSTAGVVINVDNEQIHIDPGPGTVFRAAQSHIDLKKNTLLLVSHNHIDNANDINLVLDLMTDGGQDKRGTLITTKGVVDDLLSKYHKEALSDLVILKHGESKKFDKVIVKAIPTKNHGRALGFKITTARFVIGYTSDTDYYAGLAKHFERCDILIVNNTKPFNKKIDNHLSSDDTVKLLKKIKPSLVILTHFGQDMLAANPLYEAREIQKKTGVQVIAATDGLVIEPTSYSANAKQKNLMSFED